MSSHHGATDAADWKTTTLVKSSKPVRLDTAETKRAAFTGKLEVETRTRDSYKDTGAAARVAKIESKAEEGDYRIATSSHSFQVALQNARNAYKHPPPPPAKKSTATATATATAVTTSTSTSKSSSSTSATAAAAPSTGGEVKTGMSQADLARKLNVKPTVIANYENGKQVPDAATISRLNRILGVILPRPTSSK